MSRIIAGSRKGRRLHTPSGDTTRPTSDRVREAAFGVLGSELARAGDASSLLAGLSFLDLYAGSGGVALEAASRGAAPVVAVEQDRRALEVLRRNASEVELRLRVVGSSVERYLSGTPSPFDVCWLDPPYALPGEALDGVLKRLAEGWLTSSALVVVERSSRGAAPGFPAALSARWERRYGETTLYFATEGEQ